MGFAQGVQAGIASRKSYTSDRAKTNPYAAMSGIDATLKQLNKRLHPAMIRNTAASIANRERALELEERKQDFIENQAALAQRNKEDERRWAAEERTAQELNEQAGLAEKEEAIPGREYRAAMGEQRTQEKHEWGVNKAKQAEDFKMVQWAVANRQAGPIVEFVNRYGSKSANLRGMSWNDKGEVLVFPQDPNAKPGYFKNNEELMKSFVGFMDPKVEAKALDMARKAAGESRKEREQTRKEYATYEKSLTGAQKAKIRNDIDKRYDTRFTNVTGELKEDAPDRDIWVDQEYEKELKAIGGKKKKGAAAGTGEAIPEEAPGTYKSYMDPKTGNTMKVYPDGRREILNPDGKIIATREASGETTKFGRTKAGAPTATKKIKRPTEETAVPETAEKKAASYGHATYTDPKTGKKMKATMNPDGSITTEEVEDNNKNKRRPGYGKQGYKPRSLNK